MSVNDDISLFGALALWVSGRFALAPARSTSAPARPRRRSSSRTRSCSRTPRATPRPRRCGTSSTR
ncbi:hypothetical protein ACFQV2_05820 [Actinokineospora soli]|uniref:Uncharacterized protein n=1 Tax=Actinokineospora soli TaxID=1048753 RepID=A0ABW2TK30_9PSEU